MSFVSVPKDLSKVKSKIAFGLTKRQLICFGTAAAIGVPAYIFTRGTIGNSAAVIVMIGLMLPMFFFAMYEKDGQPAETVLRNIIRSRLFYPQIRPYKTENFYEIIDKENKIDTIQRKTTAKTIAGKHRASKK
ncbi:hypothetical protein FACS1894105_05590 [Clostridia bacterium]|nr:hypothetical protein FACS1894105_05590 [Clostridia bacterium]